MISAILSAIHDLATWRLLLTACAVGAALGIAAIEGGA